MQLTRVIGVSGQKRSGKDALAAQLGRFGYETVAFAEPLKDLALRFNNYVDDSGCRLQELISEYGWEYSKDNFPEVRRILQFLGTEVVREVKETHWVDQMRQRLDTDGLFVVSDVRFENEAEVIREFGGLVVEIQRPGFTQEVDSHSSEAGVVADCVVMNTGTVSELLDEFRRVVLDL